MDQIRWGILSTARIGREQVIPAMQQSRYGQVAAIASRSQERARQAAQALDIENAYGSYEALLADPDIDAVYNPLPNHLHVRWSVRALEAGKHVLCEKPVGLTAEEGRKLQSAAREHAGLKIMEAFMYRFHPQWVRTRQLVRNGGIGRLRAIRSVFSYYNTDPDNIRNKPEMGGGGLMDIGCYNISLSRLLFEAEPQQVLADIEYDPELKIDRLASGILQFAEGRSTFTCSTQLAPDQGVTVYGTEGRIEIEVPFNMPPDQQAVIWHSRRDGDTKEKITFEPADQYALQADAFAEAILDDTDVPWPLDDAVANMAVIEALVESHKQQGWTEPEPA